ncbi:efflux RND transporter periplasmic adaptor subunit [Legionella genomosp. 1]|uniref:efflux RND transporter periplasmic adaptor subunit n=1 Tax=Legionella genomosp. 1 TaxID=1093625 RepID=UPI001055F315|nr:efflux RND transporter periplasmic adaptor subunit [Legionella genomosp. 1]
MNSEKRQKLKIAALIIAVLLIIYLYSHFKSKTNTPVLPTPVVYVEHPKPMKMGDYVFQTGNTVAFNSVNLVARVEGYLDAIKFVDGSFVKKGTDLFIIEPQPYLDKVDEAKASLAAQKAAYAFAVAEYERQQQMYKENATSLKNVEKWGARRDETKAEVAKAEANLNSAEINYSYTHVTAPFDGRIGRHLVDVGNLVGHGEATQLATIEQIDPIYVYINLNELDLIKLREAGKSKGVNANNLNTVPVFVRMQNETGFPHEGKLDFVNTGLNASTGTMQFRALLPNKNYPLVPGLFVQVRIPVKKPSMQLTVPDTAIQYDQIGAYLLVVDKENLVQMARIQIGSIEEGQRAILKGISPQDNVIVTGTQFATPGTKVDPRTQSSADSSFVESVH